MPLPRGERSAPEKSVRKADGRSPLILMTGIVSYCKIYNKIKKNTNGQGYPQFVDNYVYNCVPVYQETNYMKGQ